MEKFEDFAHLHEEKLRLLEKKTKDLEQKKIENERLVQENGHLLFELQRLKTLALNTVNNLSNTSYSSHQMLKTVEFLRQFGLEKLVQKFNLGMHRHTKFPNIIQRNNFAISHHTQTSGRKKNINCQPTKGSVTCLKFILKNVRWWCCQMKMRYISMEQEICEICKKLNRNGSRMNLIGNWSQNLNLIQWMKLSKHVSFRIRLIG